MSRFRLQYQARFLEIPHGVDFVVGRSSDCQITLDDPLVSRRHAAFHASRGRLSLQDLGSRNGVKVNGSRLVDRIDLSQGDIVTIGNQDLVVNVSAGPSDQPARRPAVTVTQESRSSSNALKLLAGVVDKALAMGRVEEAERILSNVLSDVLSGLQNGTRNATTLPEATRYALRLAGETGKTNWIDWVFLAHQAAGKILPATTVDELYVLVRKIRYPVTPVIKSYISGLRDQADGLSPTERFVLQRIEGLLRVIMA